mmetsp:Transcript_17953/g.25573  ORF Transcript_17953/g.25573 Transcript_17953/m.25573 type:complete len:251 (-) Transcript_17953:1220-1972(-)
MEKQTTIAYSSFSNNISTTLRSSDTAEVGKNMSLIIRSGSLVCLLLYQVTITGIGESSTFVNSPYNQTLPSPAITRGKYSLHAGAVVAMRCMDVIPLIHIQSKLCSNVVLGSHEAHGKNTQITWPFSLSSVDSFKSLRCNFNIYCDHGFQVSIVIALELLGQDRIYSRVFTKYCHDLSVAVVDTKHTRPLGPWVVHCAFHRRLRHQLKVGARLAPVSHGSSNAVSTCISSANNDDVFSFCSNNVLVPLRF